MITLAKESEGGEIGYGAQRLTASQVITLGNTSLWEELFECSTPDGITGDNTLDCRCVTVRRLTCSTPDGITGDNTEAKKFDPTNPARCSTPDGITGDNTSYPLTWNTGWLLVLNA